MKEQESEWTFIGFLVVHICFRLSKEGAAAFDRIVGALCFENIYSLSLSPSLPLSIFLPDPLPFPSFLTLRNAKNRSPLLFDLVQSDDQ